MVGQTESGPPGREEEASGEYKAATHHYHTDRNSSVCVCARPTKMHKTDTDGVAGLKSCADVCRLVLCLQTHDTFTPLLKRGEGGASDASR